MLHVLFFQSFTDECHGEGGRIIWSSHLLCLFSPLLPSTYPCSLPIDCASVLGYPCGVPYLAKQWPS